MKYGVPLVPLLVVLLPSMLLCTWLGVLVHAAASILVFVLACTAVLWMRWITSRDDQRLSQMLLKLKLSWWNKNARLRRGCRSYSPLSYRRSAHVWRR